MSRLRYYIFPKNFLSMNHKALGITFSTVHLFFAQKGFHIYTGRTLCPICSIYTHTHTLTVHSQENVLVLISYSHLLVDLNKNFNATEAQNQVSTPRSIGSLSIYLRSRIYLPPPMCSHDLLLRPLACKFNLMELVT